MLRYVCSSKIFSSYRPAFVTTTGTIITDSTRVVVGACGEHRAITLSDTLLIPRKAKIDVWESSTYDIAVVNGLAYPLSVVDGTPYVKGLQVTPAYIPHLQVDTIAVKTAVSPIRLRDIPADTTPISTTFTIPYTSALNSMILFIAGRYVTPNMISSDGTTLTVTLPAEMLEAILNPAAGIVSEPIATVGDLLAHPGSFIVPTQAHTTTLKPMGVTIGSICGKPPQAGLVAIGSLGEVLSYRSNTHDTVRFRYCHIAPKYWVILTKL